MNLAATTVNALEPLVGRTLADTCVRVTAISLGKSSDELGIADLPAIETRVRHLLGPIATAAIIDRTIAAIRGGA